MITRSDLGIGHHLDQLLKQIDPEQVLQWLPKKISVPELEDFVANKVLFPRPFP
jgi:hypothetical protein